MLMLVVEHLLGHNAADVPRPPLASSMAVAAVAAVAAALVVRLPHPDGKLMGRPPLLLHQFVVAYL